MDTEKILVRGVNWLGDAIMTLPALQRLREARPTALIALLTPEKLVDLWDHQPIVDHVLSFAPNESLWRVGSRLRAERFHTAIAFPKSTRSALELWLARIPQRIGLNHRGRSVLLTDALSPRPGAVPMRKLSDADVKRAVAGGKSKSAIPPTAHHIHDYLYLTSHLGANPDPVAPRLSVPLSNIEKACAKFNLAVGDLCLGLNPAAEYGPAKRWPAERFVGAAIALHGEIPCRWLIFGGSGDSEIAERVAAEIRAACGTTSALNLAGKTSLSESAALFTRCRAVLTNDTGPMHLADAVGASVIVPFGSTSPDLTGPIFSGRAKILSAPPPCAPCFRRECPIDLRCLTAITVEQVVAALRESIRA